MKTIRISVVMIALIAMISASSCSVEYRARHPRPKPKRVIVVGKADATEKINDNKADKKTSEAAIAVY